jgi:hypothetical protein
MTEEINYADFFSMFILILRKLFIYFWLYRQKSSNSLLYSWKYGKIFHTVLVMNITIYMKRNKYSIPFSNDIYYKYKMIR